MEFKGITIGDLIVGDARRTEMIQSIIFPPLLPAEMLPIVTYQFLWEVRPPGDWVGIVRFEEELISTSASIPLDVDYSAVWEMLAEHGCILLARVHEDTGLVAVAVKRPNEPYQPLMPGYFAHTAIDVTKLDVEGVERLSEEGYDWPEGLLKPVIIGMQNSMSLGIEETVIRTRTEYPEGVWLLTVVQGRLDIFEV